LSGRVVGGQGLEKTKDHRRKSMPADTGEFAAIPSLSLPYRGPDIEVRQGENGAGAV